jgi:acyl-CoA synthetase (AMP-forming)/AMP-acid ligase II
VFKLVMKEPIVTAATLVELLDIRAEEPDRPAFGFVTGEDLQPELISYRQLQRAARGVAAAIMRRAGPGARIVLAYPPSLDFIVGFFGCLYAEAIAVPVYPPVPPNTKNGIRHLRAVAADSEAELALTSSGYLSSCALHPELEALPKLLPWLETAGTECRAEAANTAAAVTAERPAFIQYTSGSTAQPKGVVLTHRNLMANLAAITEAAGLTAEDVGVSWLPMYHDMGLIGCILEPLYLGFPCYLMSPLDFIRRPARWLRAISAFGGTVSPAPSFGYDLCLKRIGEKETAGLDLSGWRVAFDGAEPINASTMRRFAEKFAPVGFRSHSFVPCYGLAEGSLIVTGSKRNTPPVTRWLDRAQLAAGEAVSVRPASSGAVEIVSSGRPVGGAEVVVTRGEGGDPLPASSVGEIWVRGPSVGAGYWSQREQSAAVFGATLPGHGGGFLRTGDLGFLADGELYVTGRVKDLIIVRGRNIYPQDVELAAQEAHPRLRQGGGAAFTVGPADNEHLVLVQVAAVSGHAELQELITLIRRDVYDSLQVQLDAVVLIRPSALPKTSSGKIQRSRCRATFVTGELNPIAEWRATRMTGDPHELRYRHWSRPGGSARSGQQVCHPGPIADGGSSGSPLFLLRRVGLPGRSQPAGSSAGGRLAAGRAGGRPQHPPTWHLRGPKLLRRRESRRGGRLGVEPDGRGE